MKVLTMMPTGYTILRTLQSSFEELGIEVKNLNYLDHFSSWQNKLFTKTNGLPGSIKSILHYHEVYRNKINEYYMAIVQKFEPDLVLVYNDQYLSAKSAKQIQQFTKLAFILGDNPFFFRNHPREELKMFIDADYIFSGDSFISDSFKKVGQSRASELYLGYDPEICYYKEPLQEDLNLYQNDLVMIGRLYPEVISSWTYKRLLFYDQFSELDLCIYGHGWTKYRSEFPQLIEKTKDLKSYLSFDKINTILGCCKIYPVDSNPGIVKGIHLRVFDCIGSGILPLAEATEDLKTIFSQIEIPSIENYQNAAKTARYYIDNSDRREKVVRDLKQFIDSNYTPEKGASFILEQALN